MDPNNATLQLSAVGLTLIKKSEGWRATAYRDIVGVATIGYGHKILPTENFPNTISETEGELILGKDIGIASGAVLSNVTVRISQGIFDALVDFTFNFGEHRLAQSTLLKFLNQGQPGLACRELYHSDGPAHFGGWIFAGGEIVPALIVRRQAEQALWNS